MSSKAMDEVNKPLGQCRYVVNIVSIFYFPSIDFSISVFDNDKQKRIKGNFIGIDNLSFGGKCFDDVSKSVYIVPDYRITI